MGNILNQPVVDKEVLSFSFKGNKGVVVSMQGWRITMEVIVRTIFSSPGPAYLRTWTSVVARLRFFWCIWWSRRCCNVNLYVVAYSSFNIKKRKLGFLFEAETEPAVSSCQCEQLCWSLGYSIWWFHSMLSRFNYSIWQGNSRSQHCSFHVFCLL